MANPEHLAILGLGVDEWNKWRTENPDITPDISRTDLSDTILCMANRNFADFFNKQRWIFEKPLPKPSELHKPDLSGVSLKDSYIANADLDWANLSKADLSGVTFSGISLLRGANFNKANLHGANLPAASLYWATFREADLSKADLNAASLINADLALAKLNGVDLFGASLKFSNLHLTDLDGADLTDVDLSWANLNCVKLIGTKFYDAIFQATTIVNTDLSQAVGLETVKHKSYSQLGIETIYLSGDKIPTSFLLGCGLPESFITQIHSLIGAIEPFQYHSCFISYSTKDEEFAQRLHSRLRDAKVRVWYSPEDIKGGEKLRDQIERAIQFHDRLLLVLSENSIQSGWVESEIRKALEVEKREGRRKLFPIRLVDFETIKKWHCFDADTGRNLAVEVREYFIPDFSNWKDHDLFEKGFERLLNDLKSAEKS